MMGVLRLAQMDKTGLEFFDRSVSGFWRAFYAAALVLPIYAATLLVVSDVANDPSLWLIVAPGYAVGWLAFPCLMLTLADLMDRRQRYFDFMVPYLWSALPQNALLCAMTLLSVSGLLPKEVSELPLVCAFFCVLAYKWYLARVGLEVSGGAALGVVVVDVALDRLIQLMMELNQA
jgi:hypothetical protein